MEEKKIKKPMNAGLIIFIVFVVLFLLVISAALYVKYRDNMVVEDRDNEIAQTETSRSHYLQDLANYEKEKLLYEKYKDLDWSFNEKDLKEINLGEEAGSPSKIVIENGELFYYVGSNKEQIQNFNGKAKYLTMWGMQALERIYMLTNDGEIWVNYLERSYPANTDFRKVNLNESVLNMTRGKNELGVPKEPYFLLSSGELVNEDQKKYEDSIYDAYKGANFIFDKTKDVKEVSDFTNDKNTIRIEDGVPYFVSQGNKTEITAIEGKAKSVALWTTHAVSGAYILTEEGDLWFSEGDGELNMSFAKIQLDSKVIDVVKLKPKTERELFEPYYLLMNGLLVNKDGKTYTDKLYERYSDFKWVFKEYNSNEIAQPGNKNIKLILEAGTVVLEKNGKQESVKMIDEPVVKIAPWVTQNLTGVFAKTKSGSIWYSYCDGTLNTEFNKVDSMNSIIDVKDGYIPGLEAHGFYLTMNDSVVNENGRNLTELLYDKYSGENFLFKDEPQLEVSDFSANKNTIKIEDGIAYFISKGNKTKITAIKGEAKSVALWTTQTISGVLILTEEGNVWFSSADGDLTMNFKKIPLDTKIINVITRKPTSADQGFAGYKVFYLLENGLLVDENHVRADI